MLIAGIVGLALAIYFGTNYFLAGPKGTDQEPTNADTAAAIASPAPPPPSTPPSSSVCTDAIVRVFADGRSYDTWKTPLAGELDSLAPLDNSTATVAQLSRIGELQGVARSHKACLTELRNQVGSVATTLSSLQTSVTTLDKTIQQRKLDVQVAKDRAALALNPDLNRSYYDGWFPLERPLKHMTYPILIGVSLFFMTIAFFLLLTLLGMEFELNLTVPSGSATGGTSQFTPAFWVMGAIATTLLGLSIYGLAR